MDIGFLHLHVTVVILEVLFLFIKVSLLWLNKKELLKRIRLKTKVIEMIFGLLILVTGGYLLIKAGSGEVYLIAKIILVFVAIPLSIIGLRKEKKMVALIGLFIFVYIYGIAETKSINFAKKQLKISNVEEKMGQEIYQQICTNCHGIDGKKGVFKASDLTKSKLSDNEIEEIILEGRNLMPATSYQFTDQQIASLIKYLESLRE